MTDKTVQSRCQSPFSTPRNPPKMPTYIIYTRPTWRPASWQLETESNSNPRATDPTQSDIQSVHSGRSAKNGNGAASQIYTYISLRMIPHSDFYFLVCFFLVIWLGGAARWGACWLKQKLYFQGVLLHIAGCLNFLVFL